MNASLLTDIGIGATGAPCPAVPQPARVRTASAAAPAARAAERAPPSAAGLVPA